jgi:hypothetical protein
VEFFHPLDFLYRRFTAIAGQKRRVTSLQHLHNSYLGAFQFSLDSSVALQIPSWTIYHPCSAHKSHPRRRPSRSHRPYILITLSYRFSRTLPTPLSGYSVRHIPRITGEGLHGLSTSSDQKSSICRPRLRRQRLPRPEPPKDKNNIEIIPPHERIQGVADCESDCTLFQQAASPPLEAAQSITPRSDICK